MDIKSCAGWGCFCSVKFLFVRHRLPPASLTLFAFSFGQAPSACLPRHRRHWLSCARSHGIGLPGYSVEGPLSDDHMPCSPSSEALALMQPHICEDFRKQQAWTCSRRPGGELSCQESMSQDCQNEEGQNTRREVSVCQVIFPGNIVFTRRGQNEFGALKEGG